MTPRSVYVTPFAPTPNPGVAPAPEGALRAIPAPNRYNGHTTSGLDYAMQALADKLHPVT